MKLSDYKTKILKNIKYNQNICKSTLKNYKVYLKKNKN